MMGQNSTPDPTNILRSDLYVRIWEKKIGARAVCYAAPVSTFDTARLEVLGAEQRLRLARRALKDFLQEHAQTARDPDLARSLGYERQSLECEVDAAERRHWECLLQYQELQDQRETVRV